MALVRRLILLMLRFSGVHAIFDPVKRLEGARLYGNIDGYAYYFVDLLVGTPIPQRVSVIVDTGSTLAAFPCRNCKHCGRHIDQNYDIDKSKSASWIGCGKDCHGKCTSSKCSYYQGYTEGSSISGSWFKDYVRIGDDFQGNPAVMAKMGCHNSENKLFYTQKANGIMGLAPGKSGRATILEELFKDKAHVDTSVFAMCLAEHGGKMTVGGYNASLHIDIKTGNRASNILWIPMHLGAYYAVDVSELSIEGGSSIANSGFGRTIVDSGTTYSYFPRTIYNALKRAVDTYCQSHKNCGGRKSGFKCWQAGSLAGFPALKWRFSGDKVSLWHPKSYMYRKGSGNVWCYGFDDNGSARETVLGATWMVHKEIIFNVFDSKSKLGIVDANCPQFQANKRPGVPTGPYKAPPTVPRPVPSPAPTPAPMLADPSKGPSVSTTPASNPPSVTPGMAVQPQSSSSNAVPDAVDMNSPGGTPIASDDSQTESSPGNSQTDSSSGPGALDTGAAGNSHYAQRSGTNQKCEKTGDAKSKGLSIDECYQKAVANNAPFFSFTASHGSMHLSSRCFYSTSCDNPTKGTDWNIYEVKGGTEISQTESSPDSEASSFLPGPNSNEIPVSVLIVVSLLAVALVFLGLAVIVQNAMKFQLPSYEEFVDEQVQETEESGLTEVHNEGHSVGLEMAGLQQASKETVTGDGRSMKQFCEDLEAEKRALKARLQMLQDEDSDSEEEAKLVNR